MTAASFSTIVTDSLPIDNLLTFQQIRLSFRSSLRSTKSFLTRWGKNGLWFPFDWWVFPLQLLTQDGLDGEIAKMRATAICRPIRWSGTGWVTSRWITARRESASGSWPGRLPREILDQRHRGFHSNVLTVGLKTKPPIGCRLPVHYAGSF